MLFHGRQSYDMMDDDSGSAIRKWLMVKSLTFSFFLYFGMQ
jgi:hypothetical protein